MKSFIDSMFGASARGLERALDLTWRRNQAITSNIANAETPGYEAVDLDFGHELEAAFGATTKELKKTHSLHLDTSDRGASRIIRDWSGATKGDGNNVDIDIQMGRLAYNSSRYALAANLMRKELMTISAAIRQVG